MTTLNIETAKLRESTRSDAARESLMAGVIPVLAWIAIWLGINSAPDVLTEIPIGVLGWAHLIRTMAPLVMLFVLTPTILSRRFSDEFPGATQLWLIYGLIGAAMSVLSAEPWQAAYWAGCYLSVFVAVAVYLQGPQPLQRAVQLNYLSWIIAAAFLATLIYLTRGILFTGEGLGVTAYSAFTRMPEIGGMAMSRASGMARFAAVPGIVSFVMIWAARGWRKIPFAAVAMGSIYLIWALQSRGAMIGFVAAVAFAMLFIGKWPRFIGISLLVLIAAVASGRIVSDETYDQIMKHVARGQDSEQLETMTGRTRSWEDAWQFARDNPLGRGPQADRFFIGEHVHNTYLYALLESGFIGAALFAAGVAWAWWMFFRGIWSEVPDELGHRAFLVQVGALLMFFTVRSIPEVCGAMYGVDLMVMLPAVAYLGLLDRRMTR
ncbi:MAG TPA: O-antigen ligase family protein [Tepidisphaeraceae bacterium]|nr:O-antigen ligase family protein [Tepidisphaeraceae bacterium]